jgi:hypothetical protein
MAMLNEEQTNERPRAKDVLSEWLVKRGFPLQTWERGDGYFTRTTSKIKSSQYSWDVWERAVIRYRGGGVDGVKEKLRDVARLLDRLGVRWEAEANEWGYFYLIVTISDGLDKELPADEAVEEPSVPAN